VGREGTDPGSDGYNGSEFAKDVFSMGLTYYDDDYINSNFVLGEEDDYKSPDNNLYNGNISAWTSKVFDANNPTAHKAMGMEYKYDQLNRIKSSKLNDITVTAGFTFNNPHGTENLTEYSYDPNGNIISLERRSGVATSDVQIDVLAYEYLEKEINGTMVEVNQLGSVTDNSGYTTEGEDFKGTHTYEYDNIGNLISETEVASDGEQLTTKITWTVQNKVKEVIPQKALNAANQKPYVRYTYDASGNRIHKFVNGRPSYDAGNVLQPEEITLPEFVDETYYLRDAQGNVMNVYKRDNIADGDNYTAEYKLGEQHLYGSDRLGLAKSGDVVYTSPTFSPDNYHNMTFDLSKPMSGNVLPTRNWATVAQSTQQGVDGGGNPVEITLTHVDMYTLSGSAHVPANSLENYNAGEVKQTAVAENQDGDLIFYALATKQDGNDVCLVFDQDNNLIAGSENINIDANKEMTTFEQEGNNYLLTQQGTTIYKHRLELNTQSGNFVLMSTNENINNDAPTLSGQIALVEDRTAAAGYLYAATIGAGNTLEIMRYDIGTTPVAGQLMETIGGAYDATDVQISQQADKLMVQYTTGDVESPLTMAYPADLMVYQVDENYLLQNGTAPVLSSTNETPQKGSAVFSATGNTIYWRHEGTDGGLIRKYSLENNAEGEAISNITGALLTAYNKNTYMAGDELPFLHYWSETQNISSSPVTLSLLDVLPQLSVKTGESQQEEFMIATRYVGNKYYELKDHLGNVRAVVSDLRTMQAQAKVESYNNYFPFGMLMPGRNGFSEGYRYGFNGKEMDNDMRGGTGATYDYGFRIYDSRIAKFLSVDPLTKEYPWYTPYQFAGNSPIFFIDLDGLEPIEGDLNYGKHLIFGNPATVGAVMREERDVTNVNWLAYRYKRMTDAKLKILNFKNAGIAPKSVYLQMHGWGGGPFIADKAKVEQTDIPFARYGEPARANFVLNSTFEKYLKYTTMSTSKKKRERKLAEKALNLEPIPNQNGVLEPAFTSQEAGAIKDIITIASAMEAGGTLVIAGCQVGDGENGNQTLRAIYALTGKRINIMANSNQTGSGEMVNGVVYFLEQNLTNLYIEQDGWKIIGPATGGAIKATSKDILLSPSGTPIQSVEPVIENE